jgi:hypothetical protein
MQMGSDFRLDRTAFQATTAEDAANHIKYWRTKTHKERLEAAWFLITHAYRIEKNTRLDRTAFSKRKR